MSNNKKIGGGERLIIAFVGFLVALGLSSISPILFFIVIGVISWKYLFN